MSRRHSAVPPPVTAVIDAASAWLPNRMGAVETKLRQATRAHGPSLERDAFAMLAEAGDAAQVALLSDSSVALAEGELAQRHDEYDTSIGADRYLERCRLKTGRLFECACLMGWTARFRSVRGANGSGADAEL